jgi:glucosamine--fructose-6-phosphate aminotransferase (isomerizing)
MSVFPVEDFFVVIDASGVSLSSRRRSSAQFKQNARRLLTTGRLLQARDIDLIVLVARGSSDNAALFGRYLLEITTGIPVSLSAPSVHTLYGAKLNLRHALVVG